eukprot:2659808-Amphidinium_carterae.3
MDALDSEGLMIAGEGEGTTFKGQSVGQPENSLPLPDRTLCSLEVPSVRGSKLPLSRLDAGRSRLQQALPVRELQTKFQGEVVR